MNYVVIFSHFFCIFRNVGLWLGFCFYGKLYSVSVIISVVVMALFSCSILIPPCAETAISEIVPALSSCVLCL